MIKIVPYNNTWPTMFDAEKRLLHSVIGEWVCGSIEHVGSTSVVGLSAKPVIDVMVGVKSLDESKPAIDVLVQKGYNYYPYKTEVMHWFCKPSPEFRTHHLHLVPYNSALWFERIQFRDHLRENPQVAEEYAALKHKLAANYADDRERYTENKWPFIQSVLQSVNHNAV
ncbi:MAG: GrpB family protein [Paraglaciecola sp.]|uniref:GrpB family protein n=1 Tax=Paraglaciecola sp. TaxID=1920173 RepID=UPI003298DF9B